MEIQPNFHQLISTMKETTLLTGQPSLDFSLLYEDRGAYLYACVNGAQNEFEISIRAWAAIHRKTVEFGYRKLLVEDNFPNQLSTRETFKIGELLIKLFGKRTRVAHLDKNSAALEMNKLCETAAINHSADAKVFGNFKEAEQWLLR